MISSGVEPIRFPLGTHAFRRGEGSLWLPAGWLKEDDFTKVLTAILDPAYPSGPPAQGSLLRLAGLPPPPASGLPVTYLTGPGQPDWMLGGPGLGRVVVGETKNGARIHARADGTSQFTGYVRSYPNAEFIFFTPTGMSVQDYAGRRSAAIEHHERWRAVGCRAFLAELEAIRSRLSGSVDERMAYLLSEMSEIIGPWNLDPVLDPDWRRPWLRYSGQSCEALWAEVALLASQRDAEGLHDAEVAECLSAAKEWRYEASRVGPRSFWVRHRFVHEALGLILRIGVPHSPTFDGAQARSGWVYLLAEKAPPWALDGAAIPFGGSYATRDVTDDWGMPFYRYGRFDPLGEGESLGEAYGAALRRTASDALRRLDRLIVSRAS